MPRVLLLYKCRDIGDVICCLLMYAELSAVTNFGSHSDLKYIKVKTDDIIVSTKEQVNERSVDLITKINMWKSVCLTMAI